MTKGRLTRQELSWLLAQEAQNAAERLRSGVSVLRSHASRPGVDDVTPKITTEVAPEIAIEVVKQDPALHVDASLDALDDVMKMLASLNQRASSPTTPPRRGRIDLAALVLEVAPDARVSIEPGSGTEVFGEETDLRRMVQVLIGHASGEGSSATVRRDGDDVRMAVALGPDSSPTAETERSWLGRMALRYGGRHELEGGTESLVFPADDGSTERDELLRELDEARRIGEVYAREIKASEGRDDSEPTLSSMPPSTLDRAFDRLAITTRMCAGIATELEALVKSTASSPQERLDRVGAFVQGLARVGMLSNHELELEVDLVSAAQSAISKAAERGDREGVSIGLDGSHGRVYVLARVNVVDALLEELVAHAVTRTPRGGSVKIAAHREPHGTRLVVDDSGPRVPPSEQRAALGLEAVHASSVRLSLVLASELATSLGAVLTLSDAPTSGLRASVFFPKHP